MNTPAARIDPWLITVAAIIPNGKLLVQAPMTAPSEMYDKLFVASRNEISQRAFAFPTKPAIGKQMKQYIVGQMHSDIVTASIREVYNGERENRLYRRMSCADLYQS